LLTRCVIDLPQMPGWSEHGFFMQADDTASVQAACMAAVPLAHDLALQ
jgi:hypothetical protein